jgi:hypothetical protein
MKAGVGGNRSYAHRGGKPIVTTSVEIIEERVPGVAITAVHEFG